ncbi:MAG: PKD domain-containing protein [Flavobacteriales bacterium]|nr:PKD domain-containing protein [Flavobacteriales bacterium]
MANKLNNFDEAVKNSLDGYESPYDPTHWDDLEKELQFTAPGMSLYYGAITTGLVVTSVVFMSMLFFFSDVQNSQKEDDDQLVENQVEQSGENQGEESQSVAAFDSSAHETNLEGQNEQRVENSSASESEDDENADGASGDRTELSKADSKDIQTSNTLASNRTAKISSFNSEDKPNGKTTETESEKDTKRAKNIQTGCTGMVIDFDASDKYGMDAKYLWNFGDGFFSNEPNPSHTFNKEGTFDVSLSVTSHSTGQITSNVVQAMIEVVEAPIANLEIGISGANTIAFNNRSYNASEIEWKLNDEIVSAKSELNLSVIDNTHYDLALIAVNDGGCADTLTARVNSIEAGSQFPRAFEKSYGNEFSPGAIIDTGSVTAVKIYNSQEELVFEGSGNKGWDGTLPNGKEASKGSYKWIMSVDKENAIDVYHGKLAVR